MARAMTITTADSAQRMAARTTITDAPIQTPIAIETSAQAVPEFTTGLTLPRGPSTTTTEPRGDLVIRNPRIGRVLRARTVERARVRSAATITVAKPEVTLRADRRVSEAVVADRTAGAAGAVGITGKSRHRKIGSKKRLQQFRNGETSHAPDATEVRNSSGPHEIQGRPAGRTFGGELSRNLSRATAKPENVCLR